ncbi:hypothetical protein NDU88_002397 [Pleurodeles waltl]|uniref:Uncharacterized protein n=1 Tax=Pleurodeles waltl TaxID=8319 RepID=A0AAV7T3E1_PLEWA|nr:hypothetical protein NDU88_002397 [Pleurodeles waltl]
MYWKAQMLPGVAHWRTTVKWGRVEAVALRREEVRGLRKYPIAAEWEVLLLDLQAQQEEANDSQNAPN